MKVLITGAKGQLGTALVSRAPVGYEVSAIDLADLDLTDRKALIDAIVAFAPDVIVNAAAYTAVDKAESEEQIARAVNHGAVAAMVEGLERSGGRLVHVSTDFVFDGLSSRAYTPDDQPNPRSAYGRTKAAGEQELRDRDLLVRTAWVYCAGHPNFVNTMLRLMRERDELRVVSDQIGSPTWAPGLAQCLWGMIDTGAKGTFHHSDAGVASWYDFAVAIQEEALAAGLLDRTARIVPIATADYPTPAMRPRFSLLDCSKTRAQLGTEPVHWRANLRRMIEEEKAIG